MGESSNTCVVIPTYNNAGFIANVLRSVVEYVETIIVVNDGSTDNTLSVLNSIDIKINLISYSLNKGKGYALKKGFKKAIEMGFYYVITIDSDGQHYAADIPLFLHKVEQFPNSIVLGSRNLESNNMPSGNTFANKFSNFWFAVQTLQRLPDTQTGYRLYPIQYMKGIFPLTNRYESELEILVRCAWKRIPIIPIPVQVFYGGEEERISHFRPFVDFFRISMLNTILTLMALCYGYPLMMFSEIKHRLRW